MNKDEGERDLECDTGKYVPSLTDINTAHDIIVFLKSKVTQTPYLESEEQWVIM